MLLQQEWTHGLEKLYTAFLTGPSDIANRDPLMRWSIYENGIDAIKTYG